MGIRGGHDDRDLRRRSVSIHEKAQVKKYQTKQILSLCIGRFTGLLACFSWMSTNKSAKDVQMLAAG